MRESSISKYAAVSQGTRRVAIFTNHGQNISKPFCEVTYEFGGSCIWRIVYNPVIAITPRLGRMCRRRSSFGNLSRFDMDRIDEIMDRQGITGALRGMYYAFANSMKSKKVKSQEDLRKVIGRGIEKGADERLLWQIARSIRPDLLP